MGKILITGCAGFIGSHLVEYFLKSNAVVIGIDNLSRRGSESNLQLIKNSSNSNFQFHKADIRDFPTLESIFKEHKAFDLIIHEAAQVAVTTSITTPREDFEINALGTFNLLEAMRLFSPSAFFEFASTNKVYGKMNDIEVIEKNRRYEYTDLPQGISENYGLDFYSPYGCSKGTADQYVRDYSRIYGLKTVVLRQSCIYGTRQFGVEDQGWVAWFIIASVLGKPITIYGDGKQGRDILWIDDLVEVYANLYENAHKVSGEVFNIGGGANNYISILELINLLKNEGILQKDPLFSTWRAGDQKVFICDINKISSLTGWNPSTSPSEGVIKIIQWSKDNKELLSKILN